MISKFKPAINVLRSENGAVLVISMMILVVLTIIGVAANNTSVLEILVSSASKNKQAAFHAAEAGIEHGRLLLAKKLGENTMIGFQDEESDNLADWNFLFETGSGYEDVSGSSRVGEKYLEEDFNFGGHTYTLTFFDDEAIEGKAHCPDDSATDCWRDTDAMIFLRSVSSADQGSRAAIEVELLGRTGDGETRKIMDYAAQDKSGAGKGSAGNDLGAISAGGLSTTQLNTSI